MTHSDNQDEARQATYSSIRHRMEAVGFVFEKEQQPHSQSRVESEFKFIHRSLVSQLNANGFKVRGKKFYLKPLSKEVDCEIGFVNGKKSALLNNDNFPPPNSIDSHESTPAWVNRVGDQSLNDLLDCIADFCKIQDQFSNVVPALAEEVGDNPEFYEGSKVSIVVNAYERNPLARRACIEHYGATCSICDFDFGTEFGTVGEGFIHVHHLFPVSECDGEYAVDPITDLRPVCPNCHAMIHIGGKCRSISEIKKMRLKE